MKQFFRSIFFSILIANNLIQAESIKDEECNELCKIIKQKTNIIQDKSGKFIGINITGIILNKNFINVEDKTKSFSTFGLSTGVFTFFNPNIGIKGFFGFDIGFGKNYSLLSTISLGIDTIAEFPLSSSKKIFFGGLLGIGGDAYLYYDNIKYQNFSDIQKKAEIFIQCGITLMLYKHNRINIIYRFLVARKVTSFNPNGSISVQYNYKF